MCYFITIGIADKYAEKLFQAADEEFGATWQNNAGIQKMLGRKLNRMFTLSKGAGCCCGLFGSARGHQEKLTKKYERKGWSKAKIDRAVEASSQGKCDGLAESVRSFLAEAAALTGELAVVVHWYTGKLDDEHFAAAELGPIAANALRLGEFKITEDTVIHVTADNGK